MIVSRAIKCATLGLAAFVVLGFAPDARAATSLSGTWELQSMGGDRTFMLEQKGDMLTAYRVMWPKFEGETYKLEHLYYGKIRGKKIEGQLLVREEEIPDFEVLRTFRGEVKGGTTLLLDGLPLKRLGKLEKRVPQLKPGKRAGDAPSFALRVPYGHLPRAAFWCRASIMASALSEERFSA